MGGTSIDRILESLKAIVTNDLSTSVDAERVSAEASLEEELGIDSVGLIELIGIVESRFGFQFLDEDLRTSTFRTLKSLAAVIAERLRSEAETVDAAR